MLPKRTVILLIVQALHIIIHLVGWLTKLKISQSVSNILILVGPQTVVITAKGLANTTIQKTTNALNVKPFVLSSAVLDALHSILTTTHLHAKVALMQVLKPVALNVRDLPFP